MASKYQSEILQVGASIAYRPVTSPASPFEYYPLNNIKGISAKFESGYGAKLKYHYTDMAQITIEFHDSQWASITFDVQQIDNQGTWLPTLAGLNVAVTDINSWISATSGGTSGGGATSANQATIIADLNEIITNTNDALGGEGTEYIFGTGVVTGKAYKYLVVNEDATFTTLTDSGAIDLLTDLTITTNTVTKGMLIKAKAGKTISAVTLLTGSVAGIS